MNIGLTLRVALTCRLRPVLRQSVGETIGDIPLLSLHRIKGMLKRQPMAVSSEVCALLQRHLVAQNQIYRADSGNDWNCLTSHNLDAAVEGVSQQLRQGNEIVRGGSTENAVAMEKVFALLEARRSETLAVIRQWFVDHYDDLAYDMSGKIPWPIVQRLRRNLSVWVSGVANAFGADIEDAILEVAKAEGLAEDSAEDAWEAMGGTLFRPRP